MAKTTLSNMRFSIAEVTKFVVFAFMLGGIYYQINENNKLIEKIASSLNKTNKQLLIRGVVDDADFVYIQDTTKNEPFTITDNTIYPKPKKDEKRACVKELSTIEKDFKD